MSENLNLIDTFSEFKEFKNIDKESLMRILEDIFKQMLLKKYGKQINFRSKTEKHKTKEENQEQKKEAEQE